MTVRKAIGGDIVTLYHGDKVPRRGLAMRGAIVYEDGRELGFATSTPAHAAVTTVLEPRGEYVEVRYLPISAALKEAT